VTRSSQPPPNVYDAAYLGCGLAFAVLAWALSADLTELAVPVVLFAYLAGRAAGAQH